jgi:hypothetical protein
VQARVRAFVTELRGHLSRNQATDGQLAQGCN